MDEEIEKVLRKKKKRKAEAGGKAKLLTILFNFLHQSFFYLDRTERFMRILWEVLPFVSLLYVGAKYFLLPVNVYTVLFTLFVVHGLNWVFNNNFWNCINNSFPNNRNRGATETIQYLAGVRSRLAPFKCISGIMLIGSVCRGNWHARSDIDMRILRSHGLWNGVVASLLVTRERIYAVILHQPLDVYLADSPSFLDKRRKDEVPIFILKRDERLTADKYPMGEIKADEIVLGRA